MAAVRRTLVLLFVVLAGCPDPGDTADPNFVDADGDGIYAYEDCDDDDPDLGAAMTWHEDGDGGALGSYRTQAPKRWGRATHFRWR